jgi:hypothetical protein
MLAKKFPREIKKAEARIIAACSRFSFAESALYEYARGGTDIGGASIRMAEMIAQNWQNLQFGIRELEQRHGVSTVEAFCWDVENNTKQVKIFQVAHKRYTRKGSYALEDPRDIYEMIANNGARRLRACILGIIPGDIVDMAVQKCEAILKEKADVTPERISTLLEKFGEYGVERQHLEKFVQKQLEAMSPLKMARLFKIYNSMKDGMSEAATWFDIPKKVHPQSEKADALKDKLKKKTEKPKESDDLMTAEACPRTGQPTFKVNCVKCQEREGCHVCAT